MDAQLRNTLITLLGTVIVCYYTYRASVRATRVQQLSVDEARTKRIREDLEAAEAEIVKLRRQVAVCSREVESATADLALLHGAIWRPGMTIERLRELVGPEEAPPNPASRLGDLRD